MGYMSKAGLCLTFSSNELLFESVLKAEEGTRIAVCELLTDANSHNQHKSGAVLFRWDCIKWDHDSIEVLFIQNFLSSLAKEEFLFLRSGEDSDDMEEDGNFIKNPFYLRAYSFF